jgi:hypothetical protein
MDKRCTNCIHRGYVENNPAWGFCTNENSEIRTVSVEWLNYIHRDSIRLGFEKKLTTIPEGNSPSCQLVQAGFSELYGKLCPYYKE